MTVVEIVAWSVFGVGLLTWLVIVLRKFSLLASIDLGQVRSIQDRAVKHDLAEQRLKRKLDSSGKVAWTFLGVPFRGLGKGVSALYNKLIELENRYRDKAESEKRKNLDASSQKNTVMELLSKADQSYTDERFSDAEKKYIEAISLDPKNVEAYRGLGRVYIQQKDYAHARASFSHLVKINPDDADVHCSLAEIYAEMDKMNHALKYIGKALELQPNNPKYLDSATELAIKAKDVYLAQKMLSQLRKANEENQKIEEYENQIFELKTKRS